jgi:DNA polymerase-4
LADQLCEDLRRNGAAGRTIGIKVRLDDFSTHTRARTVAEATSDEAVIRPLALQLLEEFDPQRPVRLLGVRVAGLDRRQDEHAEPAPRGQLALAV